MSAILTLLFIWFLISIPVALFVGAVFTFSKRTDEAEVESIQTIETTQEIV